VAQSRIADLQDQARNYRRMYAEADDPRSARARFYHEEAQEIASEVASLQEQLIATPPRHITQLQGVD
jgi:phage host-nuclease inhibitor protein Gam